MRYLMTFVEPSPNGGRKPSFSAKALGAAEATKRMLDWLDTSAFGRTLFLEDINWAVSMLAESSIAADLTEEEYCILKLASSPKTVWFRREDTVPLRQTSRERYLSEPEPMREKPRLTPKPQPEMTIVKKAATRYRPPFLLRELSRGRQIPR